MQNSQRQKTPLYIDVKTVKMLQLYEASDTKLTAAAAAIAYADVRLKDNGRYSYR